MLLEIICLILTVLVTVLAVGIVLVWRRGKRRQTEAPATLSVPAHGNQAMTQSVMMDDMSRLPSETIESPLLGGSMRSAMLGSVSGGVAAPRPQPPLTMQNHTMHRIRQFLMQNPTWGVDDILHAYPEARCVYPEYGQLATVVRDVRTEVAPSSRPCSPHVRFSPQVTRASVSPRMTYAQHDWAEASYMNYSFSSARNHPDYALVPKGWQKGNLIGAGSFGEVWQAIRPSGTFFAVKIISLKEEMEFQEVQKLMNEVHMMAELQHELVTQYFGCTYDKEGHKLSIFMEFVEGGSVGNMVRKLNEPLSLPTAQRYISQVLEGVAFLHSHSIIHRDLKGDNVLISSSAGVVKLADFGTCKRLKSFKGTMEAATQARTMIGTPLWMAPEVINGSGDGKDGYGTSADIWSVGCVMVEMINRGKPPWPQFPNNWKAILMIGQWQEDMPPDVPKGLPLLCTQFLKRCFCPNPDDRATAEQLLQHRFITEHDAMQPAEQLMLEEIQEMIQTRTPDRGGSECVATPITLPGLSKRFSQCLDDIGDHGGLTPRDGPSRSDSGLRGGYRSGPNSPRLHSPRGGAGAGGGGGGSPHGHYPPRHPHSPVGAWAGGHHHSSANHFPPPHRVSSAHKIAVGGGLASQHGSGVVAGTGGGGAGAGAGWATGGGSTVGAGGFATVESVDCDDDDEAAAAPPRGRPSPSPSPSPVHSSPAGSPRAK
eukprot:Rhum_TRINITY_DN15478_c12_g1::Rhum_TRINITY_DN15478_c12_g1_i1::g.160692::m.160692